MDNKLLKNIKKLLQNSIKIIKAFPAIRFAIRALFYFTIAYFSLPYLMSIPYGEWLSNQDLFIQEKFSIENLIRDRLIQAAAPALLAWSAVILTMPKPGNTRGWVSDNYLVEWVYKGFVYPLSEIILMMASSIFAVSILTMKEGNFLVLSGFYIFISALLATFSWSIKSSSSISKRTQDNRIGRNFYFCRRGFAVFYFVSGLCIYFYSMLAMPLELIQFIGNKI